MDDHHLRGYSVVPAFCLELRFAKLTERNKVSFGANCCESSVGKTDMGIVERLSERIVVLGVEGSDEPFSNPLCGNFDFHPRQVNSRSKASSL